MIRWMLQATTVLALFSVAAPARAQAVGGDRVEASLVWYEGHAVAGRQATLGVVLDIQENWHIQAGQGSGDETENYISTTIAVSLPEGWSADDARWPEATAFVLGEGQFAEELRGYEGRTLAVVVVQVPDDAAPGEYPLEVTVDYQACDDRICEAPTSVRVSTTARVVGDPTTAPVAELDGQTARLFRDVLTRQPSDARPAVREPRPVETAGRFSLRNLHWWLTLAFVLLAMGWMLGRTAIISRSAIVKTIVAAAAIGTSAVSVFFVGGMTSPPRFQWVYYNQNEDFVQQTIRNGETTVFAKFTAAWCANCHVNERIIMASDDAVEALSRPNVMAVKVDVSRNDAPGNVWLESLGGGGIPVIAVFFPDRPEPVLLRGMFTSAEPIVEVLQGGQGLDVGEDEAQFDFLGVQFTVGRNAVAIVLVLAFIAGFFMNFTPCVLPVIPIKILSLQAHARDPKKCFGLGLIFGLGIVAFYAALGVLMAGLLFTTERMDWGELWGNWWLAGIVGAVVGAMGLGMLGLFSIRLPQFLYMFNPQSDTASGSFFMGAFTAVLSTPCTGPLLGATVAWLLLQPAGVAFSTLVVMGLGMAFPYVLLTAYPKWLEKMPRTGPGSELIKQVMGLLLLAVATYFVGVAGHGLAAAV